MCCSLLFYSLKNEAAGCIRFSSNEKIFTVDSKMNCRNDSWLPQDNMDVPIVLCPVRVMSYHLTSLEKVKPLQKNVCVYDGECVEALEGKCSIGKIVCFSTGWCTSPQKPFGLKLNLSSRESVMFLVQLVYVKTLSPGLMDDQSSMNAYLCSSKLKDEAYCGFLSFPEFLSIVGVRVTLKSPPMI
ncbi:hypothetical protein J437_LFUL016419 [Ladona fulva]|uniref:Uncharacterized protein n=1 Tax=Ladona fulva TaxID=123851 RepID=A0A8K0KMI4_LADFU|nr:hypothetical protein J437_LFUL016419 [Ladona fulva]